MMLKKFTPLLWIITFSFAAFAFAYLDKVFLVQTLLNYRPNSSTEILIFSALFTLFYASCVALSLPVAAVLSITAGILLPKYVALACVTTGATLGAVVIFTLVRLSVDIEKAFEKRLLRYSSLLHALQSHIKHKTARYLLFLRIIPLAPFWLVNITAALAGVPLKTFLWTTALGIIPGAFAYTQIGSSLRQFNAISIENINTSLSFQTFVAITLIASMTLAGAFLKDRFLK